MTSAATGDAPLAPSTERLERPALADRPAITTPSHLLPQDVLEARRERLSRQPLLGLAGLLLVVPTALLLAFGAGGAPALWRLPLSSNPRHLMTTLPLVAGTQA